MAFVLFKARVRDGEPEKIRRRENSPRVDRTDRQRQIVCLQEEQQASARQEELVAKRTVALGPVVGDGNAADVVVLQGDGGGADTLDIVVYVACQRQLLQKEISCLVCNDRPHRLKDGFHLLSPPHTHDTKRVIQKGGDCVRVPCCCRVIFVRFSAAIQNSLTCADRFPAQFSGRGTASLQKKSVQIEGRKW